MVVGWLVGCPGGVNVEAGVDRQSCLLVFGRCASRSCQSLHMHVPGKGFTGSAVLRVHVVWPGRAMQLGTASGSVL